MTASNGNDRVKLVAGGMGLVAALLLTAWLLGYFERDDTLSDDPQVADLQRAMQEPGKPDSKLLKQKYQRLTPGQQKEFAVRKMLMSVPKQEQKLREFFDQPEAEQWKQIDREIDAMEAKREQAAAVAEQKRNGRRPAGEVVGPKGNGSRGPTADPRRIMAIKQEWTANASPELRSMMDRRFQMMNERRKQRGLQPL